MGVVEGEFGVHSTKVAFNDENKQYSPNKTLSVSGRQSN